MSAVSLVPPIVACLVALAAAGLVLAKRRARRPLPPELYAPNADEPRGRFAAIYWETRQIRGAAEGARFPEWGRRWRGVGRLELGDRGLRFRRRFWLGSMWLPYAAVRRVNIAISHRPRLHGQMALELDWDAGGLRLRSIYGLTGGVSASVHVARWIEARMQPEPGGPGD